MVSLGEVHVFHHLPLPDSLEASVLFVWNSVRSWFCATLLFTICNWYVSYQGLYMVICIVQWSLYHEDCIMVIRIISLPLYNVVYLICTG